MNNEKYGRLKYAPYGELWAEKIRSGTTACGMGLYYYGESNENNPKTKGKIEASAKEIGDGLYEITVTVETNLSSEKTTDVVAYAGEAEIMTAGKVDQQKINDIANYSINTVMRWKNDTQNID